MLEKVIHKKFTEWVKKNYPSTIFVSTKSEAGTKGTRINNTKLNSDDQHPDIIFLMSSIFSLGLNIELKRDGMEKKVHDICHLSQKEKDEELAKITGNKTLTEKQRIIKQWDCMERLNKDGYYSTFACCLEEAKDVFNAYHYLEEHVSEVDKGDKCLSFLESTLVKYNLRV